METTPVQTTVSTATSVQTGATVTGAVTTSSPELSTATAFTDATPNSFLQMGCQRPWTQLKWKPRQFRLQPQLLHQSKQELQLLVLSQLHHQNVVQLQLSQMLLPNSILQMDCHNGPGHN